ncbi:MAG: glycosyltransferase family 39 protein [Candidatus Shapirobacteria bacterium]|nr:glycosyltransferase family 39 protein [Candidatus Shapirobacteria bacterium]
MKIKIFMVIAIVFLAALTRLYHLDTIPPSLYYDELDAGYQAQIFNKNHTDYYGNSFPVHFQSFGDFRTSLNLYSIALIQKIIHDPDLSVRIPSAIFGILSVFIIYLISKSLIPSFLLAISPWAIHYSRIGFEASGMLFFILLGIYFWQRFIKQNKVYNLYLSSLFFCLSPYFYSTSKLFLIFVALTLIIVSRREIFSLSFKKIIFLTLFTLLVITPMGIDTIKGKSGFRFKYIGIFTQPHSEQVVDSLRFEDAAIDHPNQIGLKTTFVSQLMHNKYQLIVKRFIKNYFSSFSSEFLLIGGDSNIRHGFGGNFGLIYLIDSVFIILGLVYFLSQKKKSKLSSLFFWLLIFSPIPYALTRDTDSPHATRLILMLPSLIYFSYLGIVYSVKKYSWTKYIIFSAYFISFFIFCHYYKYHYPNQSAMAWQTGMKETIIASKDYSSSNVVFSDKYISFVSFFLYYFPYSLSTGDSIQNHLVPISNDSFSGQILDQQFYFGRINWSNLTKFSPETIYVLPKSEYQTESLSSSFEILKYIPKKYTNQEEFYIIKSKLINEK